MQGLRLIPLTDISRDIAAFLSFSLAEQFEVPCRIIRAEIEVAKHYNSERRQYHSTEILRDLLSLAEGHGDHLLGIIDADLYIPILTFVYGEAQLGKRCALMSSYRLHQEFYGLPADEALLLRRCEKEAVHELGHTLGLTHCPNFECVMHYSHSVEYIDLKRGAFCPDCSSLAGLRSRW
jgi:archaemetzincin